MSGAGRGTPRISSAYDADPIPANILPAANVAGASVTSLGNGLWCYTLDFSSAGGPADAQVLTGTFTSYDTGIANLTTSFNFPRGSTRGLFEIEYTPAAANSQLAVELRFPGLVTSLSRGIFNLGGSPTFPAAGDSLGGSFVMAVPVNLTQAEGTTDPYRFGYPFAIPAGCPNLVGIRIRELNTAGGTFQLIRLLTDNGRT